MENQELQAALDLFKNPALLRGQLEKDLNLTDNSAVGTAPADLEDISAELLRGIAESLDAVKPQYQKLRAQLSQKDSGVHRDMAQVIQLGGEAYKLVKDHWAEVFFIVNMLNKKGYLDKLKKNATLKPFFDTLFDKK